MTLTSVDFLGSLSRGGPIALHGHARGVDGPGPLMFTPSPTCTGWREVPRDLLDRVDVSGSESCGDHRHDVVVLSIVVPDASRAGALASVLSGVGREPFVDSAEASLFDVDYDNCQQYAGGAQYCWIMAGYSAGLGDAETAALYGEYAQAAETLYAVCTSGPPL